MVALIVEAARAARKESQQLRFASGELKFAVRRSARSNRVRLAEAEAGLAAVRERRAVRMQAPGAV